MSSQSNRSKTGLEPIAKRVPIERKIDLRFPNFQGLITRLSANLSTSGMFVQTDDPRAPGTEFEFSIRIEEWSPIQGTARVIWTRSQTESPERPAGMGVQFLELDPQSRRMIRWLVDKNRQEGGMPFDVDRVPAGASEYALNQTPDRPRKGPSPRQRGAGGEPSTRPSHRLLSKRSWIVLSVIALALAGYGIYRLWLDGQPGRDGQQPPEAASGLPVRSSGADDETGAAETAIQAESSAMSRASAEAVTAFVRTWSAAWEDRDAEGLKALYVSDFDGSAYGGKPSWESDIDQRMKDSDYIRIAVSALEIDFPTADAATATFYRSWRSNLGDETRRMVLELEPFGDSWKIFDERFLD